MQSPLVFACFLLHLLLTIQQAACASSESELPDKQTIDVSRPELKPELRGMLFLQRCVESICPHRDFGELIRYIRQQVLWNGVELFLEFEMGLAYAEYDKQLSENQVEQALWAKVILPCREVNANLGSWWLRVFQRGQLKTNLDEDWLKLANICRSFQSNEPDWKEFAARAFKNFPAKFIADYRARRLSDQVPERLERQPFIMRTGKRPVPTENIFVALNFLIIPQQIEYLQSLIEFVREYSRSEVADQFRTESIVEGLAKFARMNIAETSPFEEFLDKIYDLVVVPCQTVDAVFSKWWQENHLKENLQREQIDLLTIKNVCSSHFMSPQTSDLIAQVYEKFRSQ